MSKKLFIEPTIRSISQPSADEPMRHMRRRARGGGFSAQEGRTQPADLSCFLMQRGTQFETRGLAAKKEEGIGSGRKSSDEQVL